MRSDPHSQWSDLLTDGEPQRGQQALRLSRRDRPRSVEDALIAGGQWRTKVDFLTAHDDPGTDEEAQQSQDTGRPRQASLAPLVTLVPLGPPLL